MPGRRRERPLRVLHCIYDVAGNAQSLAEAERELGLESTAVALRAGPFGYSMDRVLCQPEDGYIRQEIRRWRLLAQAVNNFDVIHFNFGRSIMPPWKGWGSSISTSQLGSGTGWAVDAYLRTFWLRDLPLLRAAGKAVFVTFQGDDARQGDYLRTAYELSPVDEVEPDYYTARTDDLKRVAIRRFARYADGIFALNPDLLRVLPQGAMFMPYASVDPRRWHFDSSATLHDPPVVLHAPSHRGVKGTRFVLDAVNSLISNGVPLEFQLVEGLSHTDAQKLYARADLLVDQLLVGWYGALAVELMAMGCAVVCYLRDEDLVVLPPGMREAIPIVSARPDTLEATLRDLLTVRKGHLKEMGRLGRAYVERWHDPLQIAGVLKEQYEKAVQLRSRHPRRVYRGAAATGHKTRDQAVGVQN